jgi:membrane-bound lytic murein transglycosylase F
LKYLTIIISSFLIWACTGKKEEAQLPWGDTTQSSSKSSDYDLSNIVENGELIMLTLSGPETYYDYHGRSLGLEYMMCEKFAESQGVSLRVEVCTDTAEMVRRLLNDDADVIAFPLPQNIKGAKALDFCGAGVDSLHVQWAVKKGSKELADALNKWYVPSMRKEMRQEESFLLSARSIRRHIYSPMLNRKGGVISHYDNYFMSYSMGFGWDWRLMAAQCYQESCFDPKAVSWAGACGLMQIMPSTAAHLGLPAGQLYEPEMNIAAASKYLKQLSDKFNDIPDRLQRTNFVLACYNGGYNHIRDAMALAQKNGKDSHNWDDVSEYVLKLSQPAYYRNPSVKYGYMRGTETVEYVRRIRERWQQYRSLAHTPRLGIPPRKAHHRNRFTR